MLPGGSGGAWRACGGTGVDGESPTYLHDVTAPTLHVLAFGAAREIAGAAEVRLAAAEQGGPATVAELHTRLTERFPALADIGAVRYAVNQCLVDDDHPIGPADELAIIPPVSGG